MDKIEKALRKLNSKEREDVKEILEKLEKKKLAGLDIKKLKGRNDIFRVRSGNIRVIYHMTGANEIFILAVERRSEKTYRRF